MPAWCTTAVTGVVDPLSAGQRPPAFRVKRLTMRPTGCARPSASLLDVTAEGTTPPATITSCSAASQCQRRSAHGTQIRRRVLAPPSTRRNCRSGRLAQRASGGTCAGLLSTWSRAEYLSPHRYSMMPKSGSRRYSMTEPPRFPAGLIESGTSEFPTILAAVCAASRPATGGCAGVSEQSLTGLTITSVLRIVWR
jgi:hypothetical protein